MDQKDFFQKPIKYTEIEKKQRLNLNDLLPIRDGAIFCKNGTLNIGYKLEDLCTYKSFQNCDIKLTEDKTQTIDIGQWYATRNTYVIRTQQR